MASSLSVLKSLLQPSNDSAKGFLVLGTPYETTDPDLLAFIATIRASEEFAEDWKGLLAAMKAGVSDPLGPQADARLLILFAHYLRTVRETASTGNLLPSYMMIWIGKGKEKTATKDEEKHIFPAENTVWYLLETEGFGSEAARDVVNVVGGETTFLEYFYGSEDDATVVEQVGIYLAMVLHLRLKWPDYYAWMPMKSRLDNFRELLLMGSEELQVIERRGKSKFVPKEIVEVYDVLSKTMYQTSFFLLMREYVTALKAHKGELTPEALRIRAAMLAD